MFMEMDDEYTKKDFYKQCTLKQGNCSKVSWIPDKYAKHGKTIEIKEYGEWSDAWTVTNVSHDSKTNNPPDYRKLIKGHRKATGDSLPKRKTKKKKK